VSWHGMAWHVMAWHVMAWHGMPLQHGCATGVVACLLCFLNLSKKCYLDILRSVFLT
jgi:hypothetical protein